MANLNLLGKSMLHLAATISVCAIFAHGQSPTFIAPQTPSVVLPPRTAAPVFTSPKTTTIPYQISGYDYEQHMAFQHNEDTLSNKIDNVGTRLGDRIDAVKAVVDDDHKDVSSLKDTRNSWSSYMIAGGFIWSFCTLVMGVVTYVFNKDKIKAFLREKLGGTPTANGA